MVALPLPDPYITVVRPSEAYISPPELVHSIARSSVSFGDLVYVLMSYYEGSLDEPRCILRINMPLEDWSTNSLWNAIDSDQLKRLIIQLRLPEQHALRRYFLGHASAPAGEDYEVEEASMSLLVGQALDSLAQLIEAEL